MYRKCPYCGANLDPGEYCDCDEIEQPEAEEAHRHRPKAQVNRDAPYTQDEYIQKCWQRWYES